MVIRARLGNGSRRWSKEHAALGPFLWSFLPDQPLKRLFGRQHMFDDWLTWRQYKVRNRTQPWSPFRCCRNWELYRWPDIPCHGAWPTIHSGRSRTGFAIDVGKAGLIALRMVCGSRGYDLPERVHPLALGTGAASRGRTASDLRGSEQQTWARRVKGGASEMVPRRGLAASGRNRLKCRAKFGRFCSSVYHPCGPRASRERPIGWFPPMCRITLKGTDAIAFLDSTCIHQVSFWSGRPGPTNPDLSACVEFPLALIISCIGPVVALEHFTSLVTSPSRGRPSMGRKL